MVGMWVSQIPIGVYPDKGDPKVNGVIMI
jgi:hypothetical protein